MHDIGKNLVKIMMEGSGIEVVDLGVDVSPEQFVETALRQLRHHRLLVPADHHHAADAPHRGPGQEGAYAIG